MQRIVPDAYAVDLSFVDTMRSVYRRADALGWSMLESFRKCCSGRDFVGSLALGPAIRSAIQSEELSSPVSRTLGSLQGVEAPWSDIPLILKDTGCLDFNGLLKGHGSNCDVAETTLVLLKTANFPVADNSLTSML